MSQIKFKEYLESYYIENAKVEWLIEHGNKGDLVFFKGETGDRYTIYIFTKRNHNTVDITSVWNQYSHGTDEGNRVGYIKDYTLCVNGKRQWGWKGDTGDLVKQLMRQGICPLNPNLQYKIRFCRSAYFLRTHDGNEITPWPDIKINLRTGLIVNRPTKDAKNEYSKAKNSDKIQRKRNYVANRENTRALKRYRDAGGDTEFARTVFRDGRWQRAEVGLGTKNIDWSKIPIEDVFRHRNATLRSNIIEHYGMNAILATLDHVVVDEETIDGRPYKLLEVDIPDFSDSSPNFDGSYKGLYLEMLNPSTGESHFEGVPNADGARWGHSLGEATVKAALTWRDNDILIQSKSWVSQNAATGDNYVKPVILK